MGPIALPANSVHAHWTKAWTTGHSSGNPSSFVWAGGHPVTQHVDISRVGSHLALDVRDLILHRYDGALDRMGAFCEIGKSLYVTMLFLYGTFYKSNLPITYLYIIAMWSAMKYLFKWCNIFYCSRTKNKRIVYINNTHLNDWTISICLRMTCCVWQKLPMLCKHIS